MGEFEAKMTICVCEIRFMFVSNQIISLDHATLGLNWIELWSQLDKMIIISSYIWEKRTSYC